MTEEDFLDDQQLADHNDIAILMHRDAHFSGRFDIMLDYYRKEGRGVNPEFDLERIIHLSDLEKQTGSNIAALLLSGTDAEMVAKSKTLYKQLRDLYDEEEREGLRYALLIADLILTEDSEAKKEIDAIVKEKGAIVPSLIELLKADDLHNKLYPGYGQAPEFATRCLGIIGDKRAIISLFEQIGRSDFFNESLAIDGLKQIGTPSKEFLLKILKSHPITEDNERAAIALGSFKDDPEVARIALKMLQISEIKQEDPLANYIAFICEGLRDEGDQKTFLSIAEDSATPKSLSSDMKQISKLW